MVSVASVIKYIENNITFKKKKINIIIITKFEPHFITQHTSENCSF